LTGRSTVDSGAATMKMIRRTRITSMNGVTLISWASPYSSSSSKPPSAIDAPIGLLRRARGEGTVGAVQIARQQPAGRSRGAPDQFGVAPRHAREVVVDDDRRNGGDKAERGREQRLGDAGRHHREVGGLRLRNPDEAVHDAPHGAEQA